MEFSVASVTALIGAIVGVATLLKATLEYRRANELKRFEKYQEMSKRIDTEARFQEIFRLLDTDSPELAAIKFADKRDLLSFYEEIYIMVLSGLISMPLAVYMFGYYVPGIHDSRHFWTGIPKRDAYFCMFDEFARRIKATEPDMARQLKRSFRLLPRRRLRY